MKKPLATSKPRPCPDCRGRCGHAETTTSNGVTTSVWRGCTACRGTGTV